MNTLKIMHGSDVKEFTGVLSFDIFTDENAVIKGCTIRVNGVSVWSLSPWEPAFNENIAAVINYLSKRLV